MPLPTGPGPVEFVAVTDVSALLSCCQHVHTCVGSNGPPNRPIPRPLTHPTATNHTQQELKASKAYTTLRVARNDAKLAGIRKGKAGKGDEKDE